MHCDYFLLMTTVLYIRHIEGPARTRGLDFMNCCLMVVDVKKSYDADKKYQRDTRSVPFCPSLCDLVTANEAVSGIFYFFCKEGYDRCRETTQHL